MGVPSLPRAHTGSVPPSCLALRGTAYLPPTGPPWPQCPPCHTPSPAAAVAQRQPEPRGPHPMSGQQPGQWCSHQPGREQPPDFALLQSRACSPLVLAAALPLAGSRFPVPWPQLPCESDTTRCNSCVPLWNRTRVLGTLATSPVGFWRAGSQMLRFVHMLE